MIEWKAMIGLAIPAFLVVGIVGWVGGMPKPAEQVPAPVPSLAGYVDASGAIVLDADQAMAGPSTVDGSSASSLSDGSSATDGIVDPAWLASTSRTTGIPRRALQAYAAAAVTETSTSPGCGITWNTIAAIGEIESAHGTHDGASIGANGQLVGSIIGPALDGGLYAAVPDTDGGEFDGDSSWDHAVGPLQFIPSTWAAHGLDGSGDGNADPNQIDDAALSAASYLCAGGADLATADGWSAAILSYNLDENYVDSVRSMTDRYAQTVG
ncbi:lytic transglycosylase domain-containing protein [Agreia sp. COWG]|uniref:lytic transglycosylase domain-containing protein n=1 Tax=Agreia sp. COWG TaxID=2773266 RepID=UPI001AFC5003|nr:lytic murein transglycosylase [Agreia sp. COWG]CAD5990684.1 Membrane-bound lytic murein transglycosylase B [Agreia sp. COWG]